MQRTISAWVWATIWSGLCVVGCGGDEFSSGQNGTGGQTGGQGGQGAQAGSGGQAGAGAQAGAGTGGGQAGAPAGLIAFVTSSKVGGDFGGLAGADAVCGDTAKAAGLPGTFRAWVSVTGVAASERLTSNGPWKLRDGRIVANSKDDLLANGPTNPIGVFEDGQPLTGTQQVWTGTNGKGQPAPENCLLWLDGSNLNKGVGGDAKSTTKWTSIDTALPCDGARRLYCFQN